MQVVIIAGIFVLGIHWQATISVSASHAQNQTVFWSYRTQSAPLSASPVQNQIVFWSSRAQSVTASLCLQALFRIRQCFLVLQSAVSDSPYVSASPVQNQIVFWSSRVQSVTASLCLQALFRISSRVQSVTASLCLQALFRISSRVQSVTASLCLQALFRIRQCFLVLQSTVSDSPHVSASHVQNQTVFSGLAECGQRQPLRACAAANSQEHSAATAQLPGQD